MFETLRNFAEIGIAIAGFSGITSALRARASGAWSTDDRLALISLLETSALVVLFALAPQVLQPIVEDGDALWVVSNLTYAAVHSLHYVVHASRLWRLGSAGQQLRPVSRPAGWVLFVGGLLLIGTQVGLAFFGGSGQLQFIYLVVLTWHSCVAGVMFGALILRSLGGNAA